MSGRRTTRVYWRGTRAWGDFRDFQDVGGGRERLVAEGEPLATTDADVATKLVADRLQELAELRRAAALTGINAGTEETLGAFARRHLELKEREGTSARHLQMVEGYLRAAVDFFGAERSLRTVTPQQVNDWLQRLKQRKGRGDRPLTNTTVRKYLNALSDLYARAVSDGMADRNPARDLYSKSKPKPERSVARYWEPEQVAALLEAARVLPRHQVREGAGRGGGGAIRADQFPWIYPLVATAALTGARKSELFGLEVDDISFRYDVVFIRPNRWRDLKTAGSERTIPLWPQLAEILREHIAEREQLGGIGTLLFPSHRHEDERMLDNVDRLLDRIGARAGIEAPRLHAFRHSYTAARIQTLEHGAPVSLWQVARELGHQSTAMIERRYGHLVRVPERRGEVEFRRRHAARPASPS